LAADADAAASAATDAAAADGDGARSLARRYATAASAAARSNIKKVSSFVVLGACGWSCVWRERGTCV
jgi:hypothetical protein